MTPRREGRASPIQPDPSADDLADPRVRRPCRLRVLLLTRVACRVAALVAVADVFALAVGALVRRAWVAVAVSLSAVMLPCALGVLPLLPDDVSRRLRATPAAGFAVQQTLREYPQVLGH